MGIDVHITRSTDWTKNQGCEISADEWQRLISDDPELVSDPANGPHAARWAAHPEPTQEAWLDWYDGNIYTTNPDQLLVTKMLQIAQGLDATVQDDDKNTLGAAVSADT
jgi:hypothetical protein